ncbi:ABC transporter permease [Actinomadura rupiterrae]|uniref:ABC transporter permease n=1 Tax=Actinomadura rupiterrae TaxID=559627 RepID=UPI0020A2649B|nr:ABC-2 family transporter protein [Actinomadura rupiterrae]MCP2342347.1 ABC-2 type transport system permease protein [Actinomadura rupiterrae]
MGVIPWVSWYALRRYSAYPLGSMAEAVTNTFFGVMRASVLLALWHARPGLGGYDAADAVTFSFLTQALIGPVQIFGGMELGQRIRTGDVAIDLHRPVDLQAWWLADDIGRATSTLLLRGVPPMLVGGLLFTLHWPGPGAAAAFAVSVVLAVLLSFALRYLVTLAMFWLHDERGIQAVALVLSLFLSGMIVPLVAFPGGIGDVARALPWSGLVQVPADVYLGHRTGGGLAAALGFQAAWAAGLLAAGRVLTRAAERRLEAQGG